MAEKLKSFVSRWKYELVIFLMTMIPIFTNFRSLSALHRMYVPYYLYDFSMGINSRMLIGSVVKLLNAHPTEEWLAGFARASLFIGMILTAAVLGQVVKKAKAKNKLTVFVFILFFVSGSFTISMFSRFLGLLDIHMYIIMLLSVVLLENKYLRWFVPVLCIAGVLTNYVFTISYFLFVLLAILYYADRSERKTGYIIIFMVTVISVLAMTFYCVFEAKNHMFVTMDEALLMMEEKIGYKLSEEQNRYAGFYLFGQNSDAEAFFGQKISEMSPITYIINIFRFYAENSFNMQGIITIALISVPTVVAFCALWIVCIKNAEKKSRKFVYLCYIISTVFIPVCCMLSTDHVRWVAAGIICQFALCFLMFNVRDEAFEKTVDKLKAVCLKNKLVPFVLYILYASSLYIELST